MYTDDDDCEVSFVVIESVQVIFIVLFLKLYISRKQQLFESGKQDK